MIIRQKHIKIYKKIRKSFFSIVNFFFLNPLNLTVFRKVAQYGYGGDKCLRKGFLPLPVHFYSPVPDINELKKRRIWDKKNSMSGIVFNAQKQLKLLKKLGQKYGKECEWPLDPTGNTADFYLDNNGFSYGCAAGLYSMIRQFKPKNIVEIGSGHSSKVISQAIQANLKDGQKTCYTLIDPYPGDYVRKKAIKYHKLIKQKVELVKAQWFNQLGANDILFIDSSHIAKIGNDVNFLYLDVLPRLKPGVIIHIHDISLPYEYSQVYSTKEENRQFWTEQYLLQAFLINNKDYEILLALNFIMTDHFKDFQKVFPHYQPAIHQAISGSFWIQRKKSHEK